MSPGTSAIVGRRSSSSPRSMTPRFGSSVVNGIVRDLGRGSRDSGEDRRLARVRQADEPDVGDQPELESEPALGARLTLLGMLRRLVGRGLEMRVAEPAATAAGDHRALADRDQVRDERAGLVVVDRRTGRNVEDQVVPGPTVPSRLRPAATRGRAEVMPMIEVAQGRLAGVDPKVDRSSATAVAAVGAAARNMRLLSEGRGPVTTIAGADPDLHAVEEHRPILARPAAPAAVGWSPRRSSLECVPGRHVHRPRWPLPTENRRAGRCRRRRRPSTESERTLKVRERGAQSRQRGPAPSRATP